MEEKKKYDVQVTLVKRRKNMKLISERSLWLTNFLRCPYKRSISTRIRYHDDLPKTTTMEATNQWSLEVQIPKWRMKRLHQDLENLKKQTLESDWQWVRKLPVVIGWGQSTQRDQMLPKECRPQREIKLSFLSEKNQKKNGKTKHWLEFLRAGLSDLPLKHDIHKRDGQGRRHLLPRRGASLSKNMEGQKAI